MLIQTRVGRLFVEQQGEGTPVVLWPSLLCDGGMWRFQIPDLAARHRVIRIDGPGHGRSATIRHPFTLEDCADAAVEVLDALEVPSAHWAGLSWGGMTGMRVALRHPSRLRSLALLNTSAHRESRRKLPAYRVMSFIARRLGPVEPLLDRLVPLFFTAATLEHRTDLVQDFRDHVVRMDPESVGHAVDAVIFDRQDIRGMLRAVRVPTSVIVGRQDVSTPPSRGEAIAAEIAGADLVAVDDAAHLSALEQPARVTAALLSLIERAEAARTASGTA